MLLDVWCYHRRVECVILLMVWCYQRRVECVMRYGVIRGGEMCVNTIKPCLLCIESL